MKRLDDEFEEDVVLDIRMKHPCGIPKDIKEQIIKIKSDLGNKDDPIEALMKYLKGSFNKLSANYYQITWGLKECVCGMFRNQKDYEVISPTWCQCCNGHNKIIFEELLDQELQSQLIEGICAGESVCSFKIKI